MVEFIGWFVAPTAHSCPRGDLRCRLGSDSLGTAGSSGQRFPAAGRLLRSLRGVGVAGHDADARREHPGRPVADLAAPAADPVVGVAGPASPALTEAPCEVEHRFPAAIGNTALRDRARAGPCCEPVPRGRTARMSCASWRIDAMRNLECRVRHRQPVAVAANRASRSAMRSRSG